MSSVFFIKERYKYMYESNVVKYRYDLKMDFYLSFREKKTLQILSAAPSHLPAHNNQEDKKRKKTSSPRQRPWTITNANSATGLISKQISLVSFSWVESKRSSWSCRTSLGNAVLSTCVSECWCNLQKWHPASLMWRIISTKWKKFCS